VLPPPFPAIGLFGNLRATQAEAYESPATTIGEVFLLHFFLVPSASFLTDLAARDEVLLGPDLFLTRSSPSDLFRAP